MCVHGVSSSSPSVCLRVAFPRISCVIADSITGTCCYNKPFTHAAKKIRHSSLMMANDDDGAREGSVVARRLGERVRDVRDELGGPVQSREKVLVRGCEKFVPALA